MIPVKEVDNRDRRCPHFKKPCEANWANCAFSCETSQVYDDGTEVRYKCCSVWLQGMQGENITNKLHMVQKEMGETKNANIFQALAMLTDDVNMKSELVSFIRRNFDSISQLIENK